MHGTHWHESNVKTVGKRWHTHWNHVLVLRPADCIERARWPGKNWWSCMSRIFSYLQTQAVFMFYTKSQNTLQRYPKPSCSDDWQQALLSMIRTEASLKSGHRTLKSSASVAELRGGVGVSMSLRGARAVTTDQAYRRSSICLWGCGCWIHVPLK